MYAHALDSKTLVEWLSERRGYWSGRTLIDAVTLLLIQYEWLWRFLVVGVWLVMLRTIAHLSGNDVQLAGVVFVLLIPFAIRSDVLEGAAWWMTGSFNYLWPTSAAWLVLLVFLRPDMPSQYFWWCLVAALYAGSHEQVGLVLVAFQGVISITLVRRRQWRWQHGVLLAVALASLIVTVAAKGTKMRYELVTLYWFPEYLEWSLDEKASKALLPPLILRPLVENAVKHGVEPSPTGAVVRISTQRRGNVVVIKVTNTVPAGTGKRGHGLALDNVRQRLNLLHDVQGRFQSALVNDVFQVRLEIPI